MTCRDCVNWKRGTLTTYDSGAVITHETECGTCRVLTVPTPDDFSCNRFEYGPEQQVERLTKPDEPWQHWAMGPCPDCSGLGSGNDRACNRCAGTSKVRYYDDGFVGEEQRRRHPMEDRIEAESKKEELMRQIAAIDAGMPAVPAQSDPGLTLAPLPKPNVLGS